jgi:hypothetical protein
VALRSGGYQQSMELHGRKRKTEDETEGFEKSDDFEILEGGFFLHSQILFSLTVVEQYNRPTIKSK